MNYLLNDSIIEYYEILDRVTKLEERYSLSEISKAESRAYWSLHEQGINSNEVSYHTLLLLEKECQLIQNNKLNNMRKTI